MPARLGQARGHFARHGIPGKASNGQRANALGQAGGSSYPWLAEMLRHLL
ncbi:MAG: hypothetical protein VX413_04065 [Verrucomicrobiota bacterium]|nr:hypothetical protein [Verrucomicrobiota bacterium]